MTRGMVPSSAAQQATTPLPEAGPARPAGPGGPGERAATSAPTAAPWLVSAQERATLFNDLTPLVRRLLADYDCEPWATQRLRAAVYDQFCTLVAAYDGRLGLSIRAYLVRTLPVAIHAYARQQASMTDEPPARIDDSLSVPRPVFQHPAGEYLRSLELRDALRALPELIARLPLPQRQVVIGRFYEGRSLEEIAARLAVSREAARSILYAAIEQLRLLSGGPRRRE